MATNRNCSERQKPVTFVFYEKWKAKVMYVVNQFGCEAV